MITHVKVTIGAEEPVICTVEDFERHNADDPDDTAAALAAVRQGRTYRGGGGAATEYSVAPLVAPVTGDELVAFLAVPIGGAI